MAGLSHRISVVGRRPAEIPLIFSLTPVEEIQSPNMREMFVSSGKRKISLSRAGRNPYVVFWNRRSG
jgi:hypothetical protein